MAAYHTDLPGFAARWGLGVLAPALWAFIRWVHRQADLNLCPSRATMADLAGRGVPRLAVWSRAVDARRFHPARRSSLWRARLSGGVVDHVEDNLNGLLFEPDDRAGMVAAVRRMLRVPATPRPERMPASAGRWRIPSA